jgi:hypothetical protein
MDKTIIILSGSNGGRDKFNHILRENNYWTWNVNQFNPSRKSSIVMGNEDEVGSEIYYRNLKEYIDVCNRLWDFERKYYVRMIDKFYNDERPNVLVIHALNDKEFIEQLKEDQGVNTIHIVDVEPSGRVLESYDYVLNCRDDNFIEKVTKMLKVFTNNKENN